MNPIGCYPTIYQPEPGLGKSATKRELKAQELLFGLIELYIEQGKPIGSQTLQQQEFAHLSSATIRNYFALLDKEGYLEQVHTSGGRIPTDLAWRKYFDHLTSVPLTSAQLQQLEEQFPANQARAAPLYDFLSDLCDKLAQWSQCASFLLTPIFEQDSLTHVKLWPFQVGRWLAVTRSQMGFFQQELIALKSAEGNPQLTAPEITRIENALEQKIRDPLVALEALSEQEAAIVQELYNELMVRHLLRHTHANERLWLRSGLSNLLNYPELADAQRLAEALHFFEHRQGKEKLLQLMQSSHSIKAWIGKESSELLLNSRDCTLLVAPFFVHQQLVGLVGLIGPRRLPILQLRHGVEHVARLVTHNLTREYHTFKLAYDFQTISPCAKPNQEMTL